MGCCVNPTTTAGYQLHGIVQRASVRECALLTIKILKWLSVDAGITDSKICGTAPAARNAYLCQPFID